MPDYSKAKIYKIVCDETNLTYYGSTVQPLYKRLYGHKTPNNTCKTKDMINPKIYLVEDFVCERKEQLHQRERYYIENNECINTCFPLRTMKEYREYHKEKIKKYYQDNKEKIKKYSQDNKEKISEYKKKYRQDNKEIICEKNKQYHQDNKEKISEQNKKKYECECGSNIRIYGKPRHERSVKHIKFIEKNKLIV